MSTTAKIICDVCQKVIAEPRVPPCMGIAIPNDVDRGLVSWP